jgi:hypothetical protein
MQLKASDNSGFPHKPPAFSWSFLNRTAGRQDHCPLNRYFLRAAHLNVIGLFKNDAAV